MGRAFLGEAELTEREGAVLLAMAGTIFSFSAVAYRAVGVANDWQFLAYRGGSTALVMFGLVALRRRSRPVDFGATTWKVVFAGFLLAITSMLYILALSRISAATTLLLLAAAPVYAAVFGWLLLRERVQSATFVAIGVTMVGVAIMVGTGLEAGSGLGLLFAMLIPILVGLYNVVLRSAPSADPVVPALLAGVFLAVGAAAAALASGGLGVSWRDAALACLSGGVALGIGLPLFNIGHRSVPAARVSLLLMTEIVLAPLWVWIWPGETPRIGTLIGGAIVLGAVVWLVAGSSDSEDQVIVESGR
ncbi:MAG: DME family drug/metabolite transporter [Acidimicrobiales bacterium]|jgi:drug/metabolite transporter (DMT)-like permease